MIKNMSSTDRIVRIVLAALSAVLFFTGTVTGIVGYAVLAFGAIMLLTSFINFCPIYAALGIKTRKTQE